MDPTALFILGALLLAKRPESGGPGPSDSSSTGASSGLPGDFTPIGVHEREESDGPPAQAYLSACLSGATAGLGAGIVAGPWGAAIGAAAGCGVGLVGTWLSDP